MAAWSPLLNTDDIDQDLLLPIFVHCVDDQGHPLLGPTRKGPENKAFLRKAYKVASLLLLEPDARPYPRF
jgi:uncharacterized protein